MDNIRNDKENSTSFELVSEENSHSAPGLNLSQEFSVFKRLNANTQAKIGQKFFILSMKWYQTWLKFLKTCQNHPGKIDNSDLIDDSNSNQILFHTNPKYLYANSILKDQLREEKDFIICSEPSYEHLKNIYQSKGPEIVRYSIDLGENIVSIEIHLKVLSLAIYPEISKQGMISKSFIISHSEKVSNTIELLKELLAPAFTSQSLDPKNIRLWKLDKDSKLEKSITAEILTPGFILDPDLTIDECQISNNDFVIVEHCKTSGRWTLKKKDAEKRLKTEKIPINGLHNLGNTCFMNSALQCVAGTAFIKSYFLTNQYLQDLNTNNPLGSKNAELAKTFAVLLQSLYNSDNSVSPWEFKKVIARQASQFNGYYQHDSHELLSYLLTGLHEDLNRVKSKEYSEIPELSPETDDEVAAAAHWEWFQRRNQSIIVDNMYGQYKSKLTCPDCGKISIMFDPALSFTVAMPKIDTKKILLSIVQYDFCMPILRIFVTVMTGWPLSKLKQILFDKYGKVFQIAVYNKNNFVTVVGDTVELGELLFLSIYAYEDNGEEGIFVPVVISKAGEKGFFTGSDKTMVTIPRVVKLPLSCTSGDIYQKISLRFTNLIVQNSSFGLPFTLNYVNTSKVLEGFFYNSTLPCDFCKKKCKNCPMDKNSELTLEQMLEMRKNAAGVFKIEMEWISQAKSLSMLNHFTDDMTHIIPEDTKKVQVQNLLDCLSKSAEVEKLDQHNMWYCGQCKKHVEALRTYQMYKSPKYLILHLMRFKSRYQNSEKNGLFIDFPIHGLDLNSVILSAKKPNVYDLYAVSNHFGGTGGGHYTAFVKHQDNWFEIDDSHVSLVSPQKIVSSSAYILFYKERD